MPVGLEVYNDSGVYQIDGSAPNYMLKASGSGTCNTAQTTGGRTRYYTTIAVTSSEAPLIALGNTSHRMLVYAVSVSGSTWTFMIVSSTNGATFNYYVFDKNVTPSGTVGLEVYNASGALLYKSGGKPLRIVGAGAGTYASGRTYACFQTSNGFNFTAIDFASDGEITYSSFLGAFTVASNVVTELGFQYENYTYSGDVDFYDEYTDPNYALIVIDVTHF